MDFAEFLSLPRLRPDACPEREHRKAASAGEIDRAAGATLASNNARAIMAADAE